MLLHPIRMRVIVALGAEHLTTKEIHERMPEVAQASLYRAVARLESAGAIEVSSQRRKGGAVERVYRVATSPGMPGEPADVVARTEAVAAALRADVARAAGAGEGDAPSVEREVAFLTPTRAARLRADIAALIATASEPEAPDGVPTAITVGIVRSSAPRP